MAAGILALVIYGLNLGIDFKGGSVTEFRFPQSQTPAQIEEVLQSLNLGTVQIQPTGENSFNIKTIELDQEKHEQLKKAVTEKFPGAEELRFESIGPTVSGAITRRAFYQLILVSLGILTYIAFAFRKIPRPLSSWRFGLAAIVALVHDLLVVIGVFALLGHFLEVEIDALFITALLTVLGFSVHDTIIVFDRIRENLRRLGGMPFADIVSRSINQTLVRSVNTTMTVVLVLVAMLLFGGETIRWFVVALLVGIVAGTYSSIFIASPLLYVWHRKKLT